MAKGLEKSGKPEGFSPSDTVSTELEDFENPSEVSQKVNHKLFRNREPAVREVGNQEIVFSVVSGVVKIHTKIDGVLKSATLS